MGKFVDSVIAYRILSMLVIPFEETEAFRLGIIDAQGRELRKMSTLNTVNERDAYTLLHRLVYRIKRIIERVPVENKRLVSYAAALSLVREQHAAQQEYTDIELQFQQRLQQPLDQEINECHALLYEQRMFTFQQYMEQAPSVNSAATASGSSPSGDINIATTLAVRGRSSKLYAPMLRRKKHEYTK